MFGKMSDNDVKELILTAKYSYNLYYLIKVTR
jgi:hypothetical protein